MVHDLVEHGGGVGGAGGGGDDEEGDTGQDGCAAGREGGSDGSHGLGMRWGDAAVSGESVHWILRIRLRFNAEMVCGQRITGVRPGYEGSLPRKVRLGCIETPPSA